MSHNIDELLDSIGMNKHEGNFAASGDAKEDFLSSFMKNIDFLVVPFEKFMHKLVTFSDPVTVCIVLFCCLAPIALFYLIVARIGFVLMTQMDIKGKNILYVIAHPDDAVL